MKTNATIDVDFLGGTTITEACIEACAIRDRLQISVCFKFNGIDLFACNGRTPNELEDDYRKHLPQQLGDDK